MDANSVLFFQDQAPKLTRNQKARERRKRARARHVQAVRSREEIEKSQLEAIIDQTVGESLKRQKEGAKLYSKYRNIRGTVGLEKEATQLLYRALGYVNTAYGKLEVATDLAKRRQFLVSRADFQENVLKGNIYSLPTPKNKK